MTKSPRVFDLPADAADREARVLITPEVAIEDQPDAFAPDQAPPPPPPVARRGFGLLGVAVSALSGFAVLLASAWAWNAVVDLVARNAVLGYAAAAFGIVGAAAALAWIGREALAIRRLRKIGSLRERAFAAHKSKNAAEGAAVVAELVALYAGRPDTARGRARLDDIGDAIVDADSRLDIAERELIGPLDRQAHAIIADSARRVSVVTSLSPRALVDILFVAAESARLVRRIATLYGARPGALGAFRLFRAVLGHIAVTGGVALGDEALHQLVGQGLAARLSARLGEGVLNGLLTARVGLSAVLVCRPLPYRALRPPTVREVAGALWSGLGAKPAQTAKGPEINQN